MAEYRCNFPFDQGKSLSLGDWFASDCVIRQSLWCLARIETVENPRRTWPSRARWETGESRCFSCFGEFLGFVSRRSKDGSLSTVRATFADSSPRREPVEALCEPDRLQLQRPFQGQIDAFEQCLVTKFSRLTSLADDFYRHLPLLEALLSPISLIAAGIGLLGGRQRDDPESDQPRLAE